MKPIKLAVIGAGLIGQKHVEIIRRNANCEIAAICDADPAAAATAEMYGVPFYQDYNRLLIEQSLDGAIIATPTNLHTPIGIACIEQQIPILVEKPIAGTLTEARALVATAKQLNVQILVGHHRRHNPLIQQVRDIIQSGKIGQLVGVTAMFTLLKPTDYYNAVWRTQPGGGPILTNLIHDIDNLRFICGEIESVYAVVSNKTRGFAVEDTASLTFQFTDGALGSILLSDTTPAPWSYELTSGENPIYPRQMQDCYRFCGTEGALAFPSLKWWHYPDPNEAGWWHALAEQTL
ncbi:MAG: Gfo/Idh/MocA family oxidoreductase, partial [Chloroflexota bacterium]